MFENYQSITSAIKKNKIYNTEAMIQESIRCTRNKIPNTFQSLTNCIKNFACTTWENDGMANQVETFKQRGLRGEFKLEGLRVQVLSITIARRIVITFQADDHSITTMAGDKERPSRMGLHGIEGTIDQAKNLLRLTSKAWDCGYLKMEADPHFKIV